MAKLVGQCATQCPTNQDLLSGEGGDVQPRCVIEHAFGGGSRQVDRVAGTVGGERDPAQRAVRMASARPSPIVMETAEWCGASADLIRCRSNVTCQSNVRPAGRQIVSASAQIRCTSESVMPPAATTSTGMAGTAGSSESHRTYITHSANMRKFSEGMKLDTTIGSRSFPYKSATGARLFRALIERVNRPQSLVTGTESRGTRSASGACERDRQVVEAGEALRIERLPGNRVPVNRRRTDGAANQRWSRGNISGSCGDLDPESRIGVPVLAHAAVNVE